jgi:F-type H+-transporting ATPase subunit b
VATLLLLGPAGVGQVREIAATFGVDWRHFLAQVLSFGIVCALLYRFAYRRVLAMLEERRRQIAESLVAAARVAAELARTEAERQRVMAEADVRAAAVIDEARAAAGRLQQAEAQKAVAAAEQIVARAREAMAREHSRMSGELRREVGRLVAQTTSVLAGRVLTPEDQRRLAEDTVRVLG